MFRGEQGKGYTANSVFPPLAVKWKLRLQLDNKATLSFNPPVVLDGTIYFGSTDGNFYALDIESGYMRWVFKTQGPINSVPTADEDFVYFGSNDGFFYCISRETGVEVWSFDTERRVRSSTALYDGKVMFTSDLGASYLFSRYGMEELSIPNLIWLLHTFQVYEDVLYFAPGPPSRPHAFSAFDLNERSYLWILDTSMFQAVWYSFPALKGDLLYFSTATYRGEYWSFDYYAFQRETGQMVWQYSDLSDWGEMLRVESGRMFSDNMKLLDYLAPAIWRNLVIYTSGDTVVRAFQATSGTLAWTRAFDRPTSSAPTVAGNRLYFGIEGDEAYEAGFPGGQPPRLVCLAARNGRLLWEMELEGALLSAPVIAGRWMVFGTDRNYFYVLEEVY